MATSTRTTSKTSKPATSKSIASKPDSKAIAAAVAAQVKMLSAHVITSSKTPYGDSSLTSERVYFSAYTLAAAVASGIATIPDKGAATIAKGGSIALFKAIVGSSATSHWTKQGRIDKAGLTIAGVNEISARLNGASKGYNTDKEIVSAFVSAMQKGGKVEHNKTTFTFGSQVSVKA